MNQKIINQYQIEFLNKVNDFQFRGKEITKIFNSNLPILAEFLGRWKAHEIDDELIPFIDQYLDGNLSDTEIGTETVSIDINTDKVDFYGLHGFAGTLPILHFKEICILWRNFLLTPPYQGTKV